MLFSFRIHLHILASTRTVEQLCIIYKCKKPKKKKNCWGNMCVWVCASAPGGSHMRGSVDSKMFTKSMWDKDDFSYVEIVFFL